MNFTIIEADQRSAEWYAARLGRLTGSRAGDMLAKIKTGEAAARRDYRTQLICERLTGVSQDDPFINAEMRRGIELEPEAFAAYEAATGCIVRRTGFLSHNEWMAGCSLDGDVGNFRGIVELKCPKSATHLKYIRAGRVVPDEYVGQVLHNLWITGAEWCDFVSYDNRFPPHLQLFRVRVPRNAEEIAAYERAALQFLAQVGQETAELAGFELAA